MFIGSVVMRMLMMLVKNVVVSSSNTSGEVFAYFWKSIGNTMDTFTIILAIA